MNPFICIVRRWILRNSVQEVLKSFIFVERTLDSAADDRARSLMACPVARGGACALVRLCGIGRSIKGNT